MLFKNEGVKIKKKFLRANFERKIFFGKSFYYSKHISF